MKTLAGLTLILAVFALGAGGPNEPRLVGEGVISTPGDEFGFAITPDGKTAVFGRSAPVTVGDPLRILCVTRLDTKGHWAEPEIAPFSGEFHDMGPSLTPDGSRLYFLSDRPNGDPAKHDYNIWYVDRTPTGWSEPRALPSPINSPAQEYGVSVAANGTLYFASNREGGAGSFDIYRSKLDEGVYKTVENLGTSINTEGPEVQPAISPDENTLVFTSAGRDDEIIGVHKEYAHGDLYVSFRKNGAWTSARNCGSPISSGGAESWPGFSADGNRLFFASERGFATYRLPHHMTWMEIKKGLTSTLNGMGNIYEVSYSVLRGP